MKPVLVSGIQPTGNLHLGNYLGALKNFVELQNSGKYECYFFIADLHSMTEEYNPKEKQKQIMNVALDYLAAGLDPKKSVIFQQSKIPAHTELLWILNSFVNMSQLELMTQFKDKSGVKGHVDILSNFIKKLDINKRKEINKNINDIIQLESLIEKYGIGNNLQVSAKIIAEKFKSISELSKTTSSDFLEALDSMTQFIDDYFRLRATNVGLFDYPVLMAADILLYDAKVVPVGHDQLQHLELTRTLARKFN